MAELSCLGPPANALKGGRRTLWEGCKTGAKCILPKISKAPCVPRVEADVFVKLSLGARYGNLKGHNQFTHMRIRYHFLADLQIETVSCRLLLRMTRMDMDWNLKRLGQRFQVLMTCLQKSPKKLSWWIPRVLFISGWAKRFSKWQN